MNPEPILPSFLARSWWHHGLISDQTLHGIKANCNMSDVGPLRAVGERLAGSEAKCDEFCERWVWQSRRRSRRDVEQA